MPEQTSPFPQVPGTTEPELLEKLATAQKEGVDLKLLERGVWRAQEDVAMQAAIQLSQGLYPHSFFRLQGPLARLSATLAKLRGDPEKEAFFAALERLGTDGSVVRSDSSLNPMTEIVPPPAPGDSSVT